MPQSLRTLPTGYLKVVNAKYSRKCGGTLADLRLYGTLLAEDSVRLSKHLLKLPKAP